MDDEDRKRLAVPHGRHMLGPLERERCSKHRRRWITYRWVWLQGEDPSSSEPAIVRGCAECNAEAEADDKDL